MEGGSGDTPIFQELSAWFLAAATLSSADHPITASPATPPTARPTARPEGQPAGQPAGQPDSSVADAFATAADEGWATAAAVATARPLAMTDAGLPQRRPMAHHVPGSARPDHDASRPRRGREAGAVRRNLTAYQRGLNDARRRTATSSDDAPRRGTTGPGSGPARGEGLDDSEPRG